MLFSFNHRKTTPYMNQETGNANKSAIQFQLGNQKPLAPIPLYNNRSSRQALKQITNTTEVPASSKSDSIKMRWGKPTWHFFHIFSAKIKDDFFRQNRTVILEILSGICGVLPCPICSKHASEYLMTNRFSQIQTKAELVEFFYNFHNVVNGRKGYQQYPREQLSVYESSSISFINACRLFIHHFEDRHRSFKLMADDMSRRALAGKLKYWFVENINGFNQ
jgi:hypothetical protein